MSNVKARRPAPGERLWWSRTPKVILEFGDRALPPPPPRNAPFSPDTKSVALDARRDFVFTSGRLRLWTLKIDWDFGENNSGDTELKVLSKLNSNGGFGERGFAPDVRLCDLGETLDCGRPDRARAEETFLVGFCGIACGVVALLDAWRGIVEVPSLPPHSAFVEQNRHLES